MLLPLRNNLELNPFVGRFRPELSTAESGKRIKPCQNRVNPVTANGGLDPQSDPILMFRPETLQVAGPANGVSATVTNNGGLEPQPDPPRQFRPDR